MPDKWAQYAAPADSGDKWSQYAAPADSAPAEHVAPQPETGVLNGLGQGAGDIVGGITSLPHALRHPLDTIDQMSQQQSDLGNRAVQDFKTGHYGNGIWHGIDSAIPVLGPMDAALTDQYQGGDKSGAMARGVVNALPYALPHVMGEGVAEGMKGAGGKLIDRTVGLRKGDLARGAQPGRAYLEGGGGPALSMRGIANQAGKIADRTGEELGDKYNKATGAGTTIPSSKVASVLDSPINKAMAIKEGPGGAGGTSAFQEYRSSFDPMLQKADLTPNEVWAAKKNVAANTRWNDPTQFDLNKVRQVNVGGLGGELSNAVPGTAKLNKIFQGSKNLATRAGERADTGQSPLSHIKMKALEGVAGAGLGAVTHNPLAMAIPFALDSIPARTSLAKGLFVGGKALPTAAPLTKSIGPLAGVGRSGRKKQGPSDDD